MSPIRLGYFLEDIAHEQFMTCLVTRIALDIGLESSYLKHDIRNASGGHGKALTELERFLRDIKKGRISAPPVLVVAIDGNCMGYNAKAHEIKTRVEKYDYAGQLVCAVPDPHIERWYMVDPPGFQSAIESKLMPQLPAYKCEKGLYKRILKEAFKQADIIPLLGGAEYAEDIVAKMDLYKAQKEDGALKVFVDQLKQALSPYVQSG
jgi:hypothetical protein